MTKVTIDRELLERIKNNLGHGDEAYQLMTEISAILADPRQPEGEGLEVVATLRVEFDEGDEGIAIETVETHVLCDEGETELCRLSDAQRAIAELRQECERLRHAPSQELAERLAAQLLESGAENYQEAHFDLEFEASGIKCVAVVRLQHPDKPSPHELRRQAEAERDTLRQQLVDVAEGNTKLVECWRLADQITNGSHIDNVPNHDNDSLYELVACNDPRRLRLQAERADVLEKMLAKQISRLNGKEVSRG